MDLGVVVGYLVSYLSGKAKEIGDRTIEELLERLYAKIATSLRRHPAVRRLEEDPSDDRAQAELLDVLSKKMASSDSLARELSDLVLQLRNRKAERLIIDAPVDGQVFQEVTASRGSIVGSIGRDVNIYQSLDNGGARERVVQSAIKGAVVVGILVFGIMALASSDVFTDATGPREETDIQLSKDQGPVGTALTVSGVGFEPDETVIIGFRTRELTRVRTDEQGRFSRVEVRVPNMFPMFPRLNKGQEMFRAKGKTSGRIATRPFEVT